MAYLRDGRIQDGSGAGVHGGYSGLGGLGQDPTGIGTKIEATVADVKAVYNKALAKYNDMTKAEVATYAFKQAQGLVSYTGLDQNEYVKRVNAVADKSQIIIGSIKKGFLSESSGTLDKIAAAKQILDAGLAIAEACGADPSDPDMKMVKDYAALAMNCAAGFQAGPVWGTIGCAVQVLLKFLSGHIPKRPSPPEGTPYAIYMPGSTPSDLSVVLTDAQRLAAVLRYQYGLNTTQPLVDALTFAGQQVPSFNKDSPWPGMNTRSAFSAGTYPRPGTTPQKQIPAVDMLSMLYAVSAIDGVHFGHMNMKRSLQTIAYLMCRHDWEEARGAETMDGESFPPPCYGHDYYTGGRKHWQAGGGKLYGRYSSDGDINVAAIETGASLGRGWLAVHGNPRQDEYLVFDGVYDDPGGYVNWLPFIHIDELINYFVAITLVEIQTDPTNAKAMLNAYLKNLPVRLYKVQMIDRTAFSNICWTNLKYGDPPPIWPGCNVARPAKSDGDWLLVGGDCLNLLAAGVQSKDPKWLREFASIRLMTAFSQLILSYRWGNIERLFAQDLGGSPIAGDLIAQLPAVTGGAFAAVAPVDPRQVIVTADGKYAGTTEPPKGAYDIPPAQIREIVLPCNENEKHVVYSAGIQYPDSCTLLVEDLPVGVARIQKPAARTMSTRDGFVLRDWIIKGNAHLQDAYAFGFEQGLINHVEFHILQIAPQILQLAKPTTVQQMLVSDNWSIMREAAAKGLVQTVAQRTAICEAAGGTYALDPTYGAMGKYFCKPTAATEAACRAKGGTPTWDPNNLYRCLSPAAVGAGAGVAGIALLAGAALLIAKFVR